MWWVAQQVGAANGYVFYVETMTRGGKSTGGRCIDGTVTIASNGKRDVLGMGRDLRRQGLRRLERSGQEVGRRMLCG
jgi:hypothetical protein